MATICTGNSQMSSSLFTLLRGEQLLSSKKEGWTLRGWTAAGREPRQPVLRRRTNVSIDSSSEPTSRAKGFHHRSQAAIRGNWRQSERGRVRANRSLLQLEVRLGNCGLDRSACACLTIGYEALLASCTSRACAALGVASAL